MVRGGEVEGKGAAWVAPNYDNHLVGKDPELMTLSLEVMPPEMELEQIHQVEATDIDDSLLPKKTLLCTKLLISSLV
jgi:hypothetical protein